eukprot:526885_1
MGDALFKGIGKVIGAAITEGFNAGFNPGPPITAFYNDTFYLCYELMLNNKIKDTYGSLTLFMDVSSDIRAIIFNYLNEYDCNTSTVSVHIFMDFMKSVDISKNNMDIFMDFIKSLDNTECVDKNIDINDMELDFTSFQMMMRYIAAIQKGHTLSQSEDTWMFELLLLPAVLCPELNYPQSIPLPKITHTSFDEKYSDSPWFISFEKLMKYKELIQLIDVDKHMAKIMVQSKLDYQQLATLSLNRRLWSMDSLTRNDFNTNILEDIDEEEIEQLINITILHMIFTIEKTECLKVPNMLPECVRLDNLLQIGSKYIHTEYKSDKYDYVFSQHYLAMLTECMNDSDSDMSYVFRDEIKDAELIEKFTIIDDILNEIEQCKYNNMILKSYILALQLEMDNDTEKMALYFSFTLDDIKFSLCTMLFEALNTIKIVEESIRDFKLSHLENKCNEREQELEEQIYVLKQQNIDFEIDKLMHRKVCNVGVGLTDKQNLLTQFEKYLNELKKKQKQLFELVKSEDDNDELCIVFEMKQINIDLRLDFCQLLAAQEDCTDMKKCDDIVEEKLEKKEDVKICDKSKKLSSLIKCNLLLTTENNVLNQKLDVTNHQLRTMNRK